MNFTPSFIKTKDKIGDPVVDVRYKSISQYMVNELVTFHSKTPMSEAIDIMLQRRISGAPVVDENGRLVGVLSEKDFLSILMDEGYYNSPLNDHTVGDYMTRDVYTLRAETDLMTAAKAFIHSPFRRFPVVDAKGCLIGQLSRKDLLKAIHQLHTTTW